MKTKEEILHEKGLFETQSWDTVSEDDVCRAMQEFADQEKQALKEKIIKLVETRKSEVPIGQSYWRACGDILNMINKL